MAEAAGGTYYTQLVSSYVCCCCCCCCCCCFGGVAFRCDVCEVQFSWKSKYERHLAGAKHCELSSMVLSHGDQDDYFSEGVCLLFLDLHMTKSLFLARRLWRYGYELRKFIVSITARE